MKIPTAASLSIVISPVVSFVTFTIPNEVVAALYGSFTGSIGSPVLGSILYESPKIPIDFSPPAFTLPSFIIFVLFVP